jgi:hypothetical protein
MALRRPTDGVGETLDEQMIRQRKGIARLEEFLAVTRMPGWTAFVEDTRAEMDRIDRSLDDFERMDEVRRIAKLQQKKDLRWIVDAADRAENALVAIQKRLAALETRSKEKRVGTAG